MSHLIHQLIARSAQNGPDATALLFKDQSLSYTALHKEMMAAASGLLALGVCLG